MKKYTFFLPFAVAAATVMASPLIASAHERRVYRVGDKMYSLEVGFLNEPVRTDDKSGVDITVTYGTSAMGADEDAGGGMAMPAAAFKPVEGLDKTLKVEISAGTEKKVMDVTPKWGSPGAYQAVFYPSMQATYGFRIFGMIDNVPVNLAYSCNPSSQSVEDKNSVNISDNVVQKYKAGGFGCPGSRTEVTFPAQKVSVAELDQKVQSAEASAADARTSAGTAGSMGMVGIILGATGLIAGVVALMRRPKMQ